MDKERPQRKPRVLEGNATKLPKNADIVPGFLTNSVTDNETLPDGTVRARSEASQAEAKRDVGNNRK